MKLQPLLGTSAVLLLSLAGCEDSQKAKQQPNLAEEYNANIEIGKGKATFSGLQGEDAFDYVSGKIVKVQPSFISFGVYSHTTIGSSANHEFEYVIVESDDKLHTLIYPYSKAITKGEASLKFRSLPSKTIDAETFIDNFLKPEYTTDDNFVIEAEGFITRDGIKYK